MNDHDFYEGQQPQADPAGQPSQNTDAAQQPAQEPAACADHAQNSNSNAGATASAGNHAGQGSSANWSSWHSRSEEHTSELQSRLVISYAVFCLIFIILY